MRRCRALLDATDGCQPAGLASPAVWLAAMLDPVRHPAALWAARAVATYLSQYRAEGESASEPGLQDVAAGQARAAVLPLRQVAEEGQSRGGDVGHRAPGEFTAGHLVCGLTTNAEAPMIKVHVLQVSAKLPKQMASLRRYVAAGHTQGGHWQSVSQANTGDIAIWYEAGTQAYTAWGWISGPPIHIGRDEPFGPYRSPVAGLQWLGTEVKRETVREASGFDGGHQGPQTVRDDKAVAFLVAVGLLPSS